MSLFFGHWWLELFLSLLQHKVNFFKAKTNSKFIIVFSTVKVCPENEEYLDAGPDCNITCRALNQNKCCVAHFVAVKGCFSKKGFARNKYNNSIPINSTECQEELNDPCECGDQSCGGQPQ